MLAGHILERQGMCAVLIKKHILVILGQFEDEIPLNTIQVLSFYSIKTSEKNRKGHCVLTRTQYMSKIGPGLYSLPLGHEGFL